MLLGNKAIYKVSLKEHKTENRSISTAQCEALHCGLDLMHEYNKKEVILTK